MKRHIYSLLQHYSQTPLVMGILFLFIILSVTGCRSLSETETIEPPDRDAILRVGFSEGSSRLISKDEEDISGLEADLIREFCRRNKYMPEFSFYPRDELFFALRRGEIDIAVPAVSDTVISADFLTPCAPHLKTGQRIVINEAVAMYINDKEQLDNSEVTVLTVAGSPSASFAKELFPDARRISLKDIHSCTARVLKDKGNIFMTGAYNLWKLPGGEKIKVVLPPLTDEEICWAVRRGEKKWSRYIDAFICEIRKEGLLDDLIEKYSADRINR